jgi:hypothetical protein
VRAPLDAPRERGCPPWVVLGAKVTEAPGVRRPRDVPVRATAAYRAVPHAFDVGVDDLAFDACRG